MKRIVILLICLTVAFTSLAFSQEFAKVGTAGAKFLSIATGARAVGMGSAYDAVGKDASSIFWNPASLAIQSQKWSIFTNYAKWFAEMNYGAFAVSHPVEGIGSFGLSVSYLGTGDIPETTVEKQEGTGKNFSATDMMFGLSYATSLTDKFSIGGNLKWVREDLATKIAQDWGVDVGTLYLTGWRTLAMSMSIRNFGPELNIGGEYQDYDNGTPLPNKTKFMPYYMPMTFRVSLAMQPMGDDASCFINNDMHSILLAVDVVHPNDNLERLNFGAEYWFNKMIALRAGRELKHDTSNFHAGAGFSLAGMNLDYAFSDYGILDVIHRISFTFNF